MNSYRAPFRAYAVDVAPRTDVARVAVGSLACGPKQALQVVDATGDGFAVIGEAPAALPATRLQFRPTSGNGPELLAATSDALRVYQIDGEGGLAPKTELRSARRGAAGAKTASAPPLTSFDWNTSDPTLIVTSSVDTTCSVWDIETGQMKAQLIAHDREVFDVTWARGTKLFASSGADGSVRLFDLRALEHSTIAYETPARPVTFNGQAWAHPPLLRLAWNPLDSNYAATFGLGSRAVILLDVRVPAIPLAELWLPHGSNGPLTGIGWSATHSQRLFCSGHGGQCFVWDLAEAGTSGLRAAASPTASCSVEAPIENLAVHRGLPGTVALSSGSDVWLGSVCG